MILGIESSPDLIFIELLKIFCHVSFSGNVWLKFNFFYFLFINNQSAIELFVQDIIRSGENHDS